MIASASTPDRLQDAVRILRAAGYLQRRAREACASEADTAHIRRTCADAAWVLLNGRPETPSLPEAVHALLAAGTLPVSGFHQLVVDACGLLKQTSASDHDLAAQTFKCIVRPLGEFAGITAALDGSGYEGALRSWQELAEHAASMDSGLNTSPLLFEALAGLQRLHRVVIPSGKGTSSRLHIGSLGPYLLTGCANLVDHLGQTISSTRPAALCRCGHSKAKPFCDGSHVGAEFITAKDPRRVPDRRDVYEGQAAIVFDNRGLCAHAGFCTDRLNGVFHVDREPFVTPSGGRLDDIIRAVRRCPSGALSLGMDGQETRGHVDQPREPTVEVSRNGPYRVTGAIPIFDEIGAPVARAEGASLEHCSLCRCGSSLNKPFCSGMHWSVNFSDPAPTTEPTLFEWAGGYPALLDMTTIFYGKYVPQDPLIGPLFADMSPDHPERVAAWLSEVFGGPKLYSERYGGYARMISQHVGKNIKPEQRARLVALMAQSADEA